MGLLDSDTHGHLLRYGISADQRYLSGAFLDTYDATVINGNMVAHIPAAMAAFLGDKATLKPFIIDPLTHAFQHDPSKISTTTENEEGGETQELKSSIRKMSEAFGPPVQSLAGEAALLPSDFGDDPALRNAFCQRVISFQLDTINKHAQQKQFMKYLRYIGITGREPDVVVAPYFWMTSATAEDWLPINLEFVRCAGEHARGKQVCAQLVIAQDLLADDYWAGKLVEDYGKTDCNGVLVWIDEFSEHAASRQRLLSFARFLQKLSTIYRKRVMNLYGGYFSILLCQLPEIGVLHGVCHGLEYGEQRGVVPVGGGIPMSKFYLPPYHRRLRSQDAVRAIRRLGGFDSVTAYREKICSCPACLEVITQNPSEDFERYTTARPIQFRRRNQVVTLNYPTPETKDLCLRHYLHNKHREFEETKTRAPLDIAESLEAYYEGAARILGGSEAAYLRDWAAVVRQLAGLPERS